MRHAPWGSDDDAGHLGGSVVGLGRRGLVLRALAREPGPQLPVSLGKFGEAAGSVLEHVPRESGCFIAPALELVRARYVGSGWGASPWSRILDCLKEIGISVALG